MKAIEQYFHVVMFITLYKVVLTFSSVYEILGGKLLSVRSTVAKKTSTYLCLHHEVTLRSEYSHVSVYIDSIFMFNSFQHGVYDDETGCATNTATATQTNMYINS